MGVVGLDGIGVVIDTLLVRSPQVAALVIALGDRTSWPAYRGRGVAPPELEA